MKTNHPGSVTQTIPSWQSFIGKAGAAFLSFAASIIPAQAAVVSEAVSIADGSTAIRPIHVHVPEAYLIDPRRRILATRWPDQETVSTSPFLTL